MERIYYTWSFGTTRCIGIMRTITILTHLICLKILYDEMFRYCEDNTYITYIIVIVTYRSHNMRSHLIIPEVTLVISVRTTLCETTLLYIVDWLLQWSKDFSDTTVFG